MTTILITHPLGALRGHLHGFQLTGHVLTGMTRFYVLRVKEIISLTVEYIC